MERDERRHWKCEPSALFDDAGNDFFQLGMSHTVGRSAPVDLVSAHKWFSIAAMRGHEGATRLRREIAADMSKAEIMSAQRAAREWVTTH